MISEGYSDKDIEYIDDIIKCRVNETTSATGGPAGAASATVGGGGVALANATTAGMGPIQSGQPSAFPGALNGIDWISGGGTEGSGDIAVPYNPSGKNRVFQKVPMGKGHGARTGKKSREKKLDLKSLRDILKNKDKDMEGRPRKVLNFDSFAKDKLNQVTKVKEGKAYKSARPHRDKSIGKDGILLTNKKETFRSKILDHVISQDCDADQIGNDLEIYYLDDMIAQVMFRDDYIGIRGVDEKFIKEYSYNELGVIKKHLSDIIRSYK